MYRKYHAKLKSEVLTIFAGEFYVCDTPEVIATVLGSCVSVCLYDPQNNIYGMNHFMLPHDKGSIEHKIIDLKSENLEEKSLRYGMASMERLIGDMQKRGAERKYLRAKIFGGGHVLGKQKSSELFNVGDRNIAFTHAYLHSEGIPIEKEDVGDSHGRKIYYLTGKNKVFVKSVDMKTAEKEEEIFLDKINVDQKKKKTEGVTLF